MDRSSRNVLTDIYRRLLTTYGPQHWWPARTREETIIGAVLTQNTAWGNVERAIAALRRARCLTLRRIHRLPLEQLEELVRPSGTYRVKAQRLKNLASWLEVRFGGDLDALFALGAEQARRELLTVKGIGPETADDIVLYAGRLPSFVVDAYTLRMLRRHFLIAPRDGYERAQSLFHLALPPDSGVYGEYHALIVELGKRHCRRHARCADCPLESLRHDADL